MGRPSGRRKPYKHATPGDAEFWAIINVYKHRCKNFNIFWGLTEEDCRKLLKDKCFYCGGEPANKKILPHSAEPYIYNGIDRINSHEGYTELNSVTACGDCNYAKNNLSLERFKELIKKIYFHLHL